MELLVKCDSADVAALPATVFPLDGSLSELANDASSSPFPPPRHRGYDPNMDRREANTRGELIDVLFGAFLITLGVFIALPTIFDLAGTLLGYETWLLKMCHHGIAGAVLMLIGIRFLRRGLAKNQK